MGRFFEKYKGNAIQQGLIWQEVENLFPYICGQCRREFPQGGKRFVASSMNKLSHASAGCRCDDCQKGIDPNRQKVPIYAQRRTELD